MSHNRTSSSSPVVRASVIPSGENANGSEAQCLAIQIEPSSARRHRPKPDRSVIAGGAEE